MSDEGDATPDRQLPAKRPRVDAKYRRRAVGPGLDVVMPPQVMDHIVSFIALPPSPDGSSFGPVLNLALCSRACLAACERSCMSFRVRTLCRTADSSTRRTRHDDDDDAAGGCAAAKLGCQLAEGRCCLAFLKHYVDEREWQWKVATSTPESLQRCYVHTADEKTKAKLDAFKPRVRRIMSTKKRKYEERPRKCETDNIYKQYSFGAIWFPSLDNTKNVFVFCNGKVHIVPDWDSEGDTSCLQMGFCCVDTGGPAPPRPPKKILDADYLDDPWVHLIHGTPEQWRENIDEYRDDEVLESEEMQQLMTLADWPCSVEEDLFEFLRVIVSLCGVDAY
ncbi:hypothetical protein Pelo_6259 [Pelomyxa schiedti]|nr:hypothetical protein Pelo_6259 [Pelomyxa schiedti]